MAKKVRKPRSASPRTYSQAGPQPVQSAVPAPAAVKPQSAAKSANTPAQPASRYAKEVDLRAEYPYVGKDLAKLGITAGVMFGVLIVLNVVLNLVR